MNIAVNYKIYFAFEYRINIEAIRRQAKAKEKEEEEGEKLTNSMVYIIIKVRTVTNICSCSIFNTLEHTFY